MRTVLMIYDKFPPHSLSGAQRPFQFAKHLPAHGYSPYIISVEPEPGDPVDPKPLEELDPCCQTVRLERLTPRYSPQIARLRALLTGDLGTALRAPVSSSPGGPDGGASIPIAPPPPRVGPPPIHSPKDFAYYAINWGVWFHADWALPVLEEALRAARDRTIDLVWASGPAARNLFAGYLTSLVLRKPLVVDIRDPWTYGSVWQPVVPAAGTVEAFWARRVLAHAKRSVFTSPLTQANMQKRFPGIAAQRMCTVTNGFADDVAPEQALRGASDDKCVMSYIGSLNVRRKPDILLQALARLCDDPAVARDLRLQFVGGMGGHAAKIDEWGVREQVIDVGRVGHRDSVRYMWGADVNILLQTITTGQDVIAGKTFEYLASRRPILAVVAPDGGDAWLLEDTGAGRAVACDDLDAVVAEMGELYRRWKRGERGAGLSEDALARFSRRSLTADLAKIFDATLDTD